LRVFERWKDQEELQWVLELLYPDLKDQLEWLWQERRVAPLMMLGVGSDSCIIPGIKHLHMRIHMHFALCTLHLHMHMHLLMHMHMHVHM
jgi:hypothetical protein